MSNQEKAIKIEQLKDERNKAKDALFLKILSVSSQIDAITNQMYKLGCDRQKLYNELTELRKQKLRNEDHYDLLIRAQIALNCENKLQNSQLSKDNLSSYGLDQKEKIKNG